MAFLPLVTAGLSIAGGVIGKQNADADAAVLRSLGKAEAGDRRRQTRRLLASQKVAFAKAGVATNVGTPLDVMGDTVAEEELAALRIRFGRKSESNSLKRAGDLALFQGIASGAGTVLGSIDPDIFGSASKPNKSTPGEPYEVGLEF